MYYHFFHHCYHHHIIIYELSSVMYCHPYITTYITIYHRSIGCEYFLPNAIITRSFHCTATLFSSIEANIRVTYDHLSYPSDDMFPIPYADAATTTSPIGVNFTQTIISGTNKKQHSTYLDRYSSSTSKTNWYDVVHQQSFIMSILSLLLYMTIVVIVIVIITINIHCVSTYLYIITGLLSSTANRYTFLALLSCYLMEEECYQRCVRIGDFTVWGNIRVPLCVNFIIIITVIIISIPYSLSSSTDLNI